MEIFACFVGESFPSRVSIKDTKIEWLTEFALGQLFELQFN